ncbi:Magnesium-chelatase 60 kDa subunit (Mg-protoporphyrin IX chelatase) (Mg-chelatase subunit D) [Bradyrhizobium sp. ORS 285]|uniref:magnesium chelatase subunit D n=1 Tax=Bradyrhizobium sp. ORS 285 TaxID=115808 RepID=UPI0002406883|nr:magnesium chelatase subunit D [Bradyrhizobium sp. ORS 285]CCD90158.1 Magnesium-chelatase 60 kDa subunit (Mg-protoporphyrin IX chelatase) (Mg-chelatase subunit D) [Bradyrhizobium sp. ORS 285]SMX60577.1 Magnesium-chelatase 60 kDa subunit (Mg-protoporphyrin IX chelatase) (Mg-chelatase subunit D) [Bradyrhizobium sp. ORS 285]
MSDGAAIWADAVIAAALAAIDPTASVLLRAGAGPVREQWLELLRELMPASVQLRKLPPSISDDRLLGGLDLAATLQAGRPVMQRGLLAEADGGVLIAVMAERMAPSAVAHLCGALDTGAVSIERDGLSLRAPARFGLIALDEGIGDERVPPALAARLACHLDLGTVARADLGECLFKSSDIVAARALLPKVRVSDDAIAALTTTAVALGIDSLRAPLLACRVARIAAALDGELAVAEAHIACAARLVLAPRATRLPATDDNTESNEAPEPQNDQPDSAEDDRSNDGRLEDRVLEAAQAAIPADLLKRLQDERTMRARSGSAGRQGNAQKAPKRGRPIGARRGEWRAGARLNVLETLRAAAPWQPLRRRAQRAGKTGRLMVHKDDIRITRFKQRSGTTTIFVVDASGSSALQRLAEVKGAVELLLAECYIRRDEVALIAFRGKSAELLLPPTRSLTRAKRSLAGLPGGGGTPLSAAIFAATELALAVKAKGQAPTIVLMTDGRANVARDGGGRSEAEAEALVAAKQLALTGIPVVLVDSSPRPQDKAAQLAGAMQARYIALPHADATRLSQAVTAQAARG